MLDETHLLLQLEDMLLPQELSKLLEQHSILFEEEGELQDEQHDKELFDGQLDDWLLHFSLNEQLKLLLLFEKLLNDELSKLLEQQGLSKDDDSKLLEELLDKELLDGQLEELLLLCSLDEKLKLLQLLAKLLKLELLLLLEQQGLSYEDDGELQEMLVDKELSDGQLDE